MRIRANHLTVLRIILLPLPYFLVYGGKGARIAAILAFALLGITDYLDGLLARHDGSTALGRLLDPLADKIFVVVSLIPLVDLHILPLWIVWPIFLREFLVTELRRFLTGAKKELHVTEIAKIKTTIQMIGAGLILTVDTFPDKTVAIALLSGALIATVFLAIGLYWRDNYLSSRMRVALGLLVLGLGVGLAFRPHQIILTYGLIMLGITLVSGSQYLLIGLPECLKQGLPALGRLIASLLLPLLTLALMPLAPQGMKMTSLVVLILALEFGGQGLDMWAAQEGKTDISWIKIRIVLPLALLSLVLGQIFYGLTSAIEIFFWTTTGLCICYVLASIWIYWRLSPGKSYA
ncbi:MAG: hypothetical protein GWP10_03300 [Nitrospiraceae bacterium]|nr:hypothetical protein [Nitrospiraceae bacterium]